MTSMLLHLYQPLECCESRDIKVMRMSRTIIPRAGLLQANGTTYGRSSAFLNGADER